MASEGATIEKSGLADQAKLEEASEPQIITGYNLSYEGARPRCTSAPVPTNPSQYHVSCLAVQIVDGIERIPTKTADGLTLAWERPTAPVNAGFNVVSCSTTSQNLAQNCVIQVPAATTTVDVSFNLTLTEAPAGKEPRRRTDSDVIVLPYSVMSIGFVPEIPQLVLTDTAPTKPTSSIGALRLQDEAMLVSRSWVFAAQRIPNSEFTLTKDAQSLYCGDRLYLSSRSRLFMLDRDEVKHVAGSVNERNLDDLSHPLRTYWMQLASLACKRGNVLIETRRPTRIYELSPEGVITLVAKDHLETEQQEASSVAVDGKGNVYYLDGKNIRRRTPTGAVELAYEGNETLMFPWSLGLDETPTGELKAFIVLDIGTPSPTVVSINVASGVLSPLAGNGSGEDANLLTEKRDGITATRFALRSTTAALAVGRSPSGQRVVLVGEGGTPYAPDANGDLLAIDANGIAQVLLRAGTVTRLETMRGGAAISAPATVNGWTGSLAITPRGEAIAKVSFAATSETTSNFMTIPLTRSGSAKWAAGRIPSAPASPTAASKSTSPSKIAHSKATLSGNSITTFGSDGTLYIVDVVARTLFKLDGDALIRLPVRFDGDVIAATIARDAATKQDRLVYVEYVESLTTKRIQSLRLSGNSSDQPSTVVASPNCDISYPANSYYAPMKCQPRAVAIDPNGQIVFYDHGYRLIRRRNANGSFSTLAGTHDLKVAANDRSAGTLHNPLKFGFSLVSTLRYDGSGALIFVEQGGSEQYNDGGDPAVFKPVVGKLELGSSRQSGIAILVGSNGEQTAANLETKPEIPLAQFQLGAPIHVAPLSDGSLLFNDGDVVLMQRGGVIKRFFGGKLANADCGAGTLDRVTAAGGVPTLTNALGRFCAGHTVDLNTTGSCSGGKTLISMGQATGEISFDINNVIGWVLRLEVACDGTMTR